MAGSRTYDSHREALEFREQLSSDKRRIVFLFGAGTSQAVGIDGIGPLTEKLASHLTADLAEHYTRIRGELGPASTVEHILNHVRTCRELLAGREKSDVVLGLRLKDVMELDMSICRYICHQVGAERATDIEPHVSFAQWIRSISRAHPVEIFTTNYDVLIERGLETMETPHFDGFVGTFEPRFSASSVEADDGSRHDEFQLPRGWARVWKLHGSVTWRLRRAASSRQLLVRVADGQDQPGDELMIFPTRDKYSESRKLPFIAYHDRLRRVLGGGEVLLVTAGYSFSDQHVNEIIFEALRWNNRLAVTALLYGNMSDGYRENLLEPTQGFANLTAYCADRAVVSGIEGAWTSPPQAPSNQGGEWPFWDKNSSQFTLGDFRAFASYLTLFLGGRTYSASSLVAAAASTTTTTASQAPAIIATPLVAQALPNPAAFPTEPTDSVVS